MALSLSGIELRCFFVDFVQFFSEIQHFRLWYLESGEAILKLSRLCNQDCVYYYDVPLLLSSCCIVGYWLFTLSRSAVLCLLVWQGN